MDICTIVGKTFFSFLGQDGKPVEGYKYYATAEAPLNDPNFVGKQALIFTASAARRNQWKQFGLLVPDIGTTCYPVYNKYGKVDCFIPVPAAPDSKDPKK